MKDYKPTIGIECHVQLKTISKLFAGVSNDSKTAAPNTNVSPICFGLPGVLPMLNSEAVTLSIKAGLALNAKINHFSKFDRKHYFYPDLPKGYQITQFDQPIIGQGSITCGVNGEYQIGIERAHLEEDAGKSTHPEGADYSLVDLNRAGTPLLEIVSRPDMHSAKEAKAYAEELFKLMVRAGVTDGDLYNGNMRFDVNVSVSATPGVLGTRTETKNLNSFKAVERAVDFEIKRQIEVLEAGESVIQETRGWDDSKNKTFSQRTKEDAHDYRYFPEPDLPPIVIDDERIQAIKEQMPPGPAQIRDLLRPFGIDPSQVETVIMDDQYCSAVLSLKNEGEHLKRIISWLVGPIQEHKINQPEAALIINPDSLKKLSKMTGDGLLNSTAAKEVLMKCAQTGEDPEKVASDLDLIQESDEGGLEQLIKEVLDQNQKAVSDLKLGEQKALGFLIGQVMKVSGGKANPQLAAKIINQLVK